MKGEGRAALSRLLEANADLNTVYLLKDALAQIWLYRYPKVASKALDGWVELAIDTGISELARFARGLLSAKEQIVSFCTHQITSARIESFNAAIQRVLQKSCGITNVDYLWLKLRQVSLQP